MNILITGGSGFIGKNLSKDLFLRGHKIIVLSRKPSNIDANYRAVKSLDEFSDDDVIDVVVNLAGAPIDRRWTKSYKEEIISSRIGITQDIYHLIKRLKTKPQKVLNASAIGYYGYHEDNIELVEESAPIDSFSHQVCKLWEQEAYKIEEFVPVCILRFGVVLGASGGLIKKMLPIFKLGLGGRIGDGSQYMSWVHIEDLVSVCRFLLVSEKRGVFNVTAPESVSNADFVRIFGETLNRFSFVHLPSIFIKIVYGEMGEELLLNSQRVLPKRLQKNGFSFQYPTLSSALKNIIKNK